MLKKLLFLLFIQQIVFAQTTQNLRGNIKELNTNKNIVGANLQLSNTKLIAQSDSNGVFRFDKIPTGRYALQVSCIGFETLLIPEILLDAGKETLLDVQLQEKTNQLNEALVRAIQPKSLSNIETITKEQVLRFPATFFDPARLATAFAGVINDNDQANGMVIRGNSPNFMQWRLEGVEIVNPNHLSNAGTFSDRPTQNAGGVNALSAQLLGTTTLLKGALPVEYGNVLSGVMDMRLRKGNNEKHEFLAQAGLIGFDFSAEGPFSEKGKSSYLINYRYSFTGLLGAMGVSFGGEDIRFQDLSFNLSFPTKKLGDFTVFGIFGKSSNDFTAQKDATLWEGEKDRLNINFKNNLYTTGITQTKQLSQKLHWKNVLSLSGLENSRNELADNYSIKDLQRKEIHTFLSNLTLKQNLKNTFRAGLELNWRNSDAMNTYNGLVLDDWLKKYSSTFQPYADWQYASNRLKTQIGLRYLSGSARHYLEPRAAVNYQLNQKHQLFGAASRQNVLLTSSSVFHVGLGHQLQINPYSSLKTEIYYQKPINSYCFAEPANAVSTELNDLVNLTTKNYGIELSYQQFLQKGFYLLSNISLYRAITKHNNIERAGRFDGRFTSNLTAGKEWTRTKNRVLGLNLRVVYRGGFRETAIDVVESKKIFTGTIFSNDPALLWANVQANYFRPDLSIYLKKNKGYYTRTLSLDIQNVANYQNQGASYYDHYLQKVLTRTQLGIIPVLNYRVSF